MQKKNRLILAYEELEIQEINLLLLHLVSLCRFEAFWASVEICS